MLRRAVPHLPESAPGNFSRKALTAAGIGAAFLAGLLVGWYTVRLLLLLFAGVLAAVLLDALTRLAMAWTPLHRRTAAFGLTVVLLMTLAGALFWFEWSRISEQVDQLMQQTSSAIEQVAGYLEGSAWGRAVLNHGSEQKAVAQAGRLIPQITQFFSSAFSGIMDLVVIAFVGFYLAATPHAYVEGLVRLAPQRQRSHFRDILGEVGERLRWWLAARFFTMAVVALVVGVGLWFLGISLALTLGLLAGLLDFIPVVGPLLAAVPALLLAVSQEPTLAMWVGALYVGSQIVEGYLIMPLIQHRAISIPPALIIAMVVLFGTLFGMLGVLLAAPLTAVGMVLIQRLYVEDLLGDRHEAA
ncbi:AI-2E family transporter [Nitrospira moscoviensis]|uniref:AI-2E family transporter n=1 Tax=Nitrospira moscoviensis TaxID=42253 RepID=A0A0K2GE87_NITMO|nr:AI-2E family transporter [Nitrospira moscoviensis]ALA59179.1 conserved membrane protein of unknown function [Nitrospira moscoviensis]